MEFLVIVKQVIILAFLAIIGAVATKFKVITEQVKDSIAKLVFNLTLPFLIITSVTQVKVSSGVLLNSVIVIIIAIVAITLLYFTGKISKTLLKLKNKQGNIHLLHTMFGNVAFLGYPLFSALFPGGEGLFYAVIYHLTQDILIWTVGIFIFNNTKDLKLTDNLKHLVNPNTVSFLIGFLMLLSGTKFPGFILAPISGLGKTTIYLAMLYIGAILAQNTMIASFRKPEIYILSINKMILVPFILLVLVNIITKIFSISIGEIAKTVVIMQAAMPCMTIIVVLARRFKSDDIHAAENLFLSTLLSIGTLPLIYYLIRVL